MNRLHAAGARSPAALAPASFTASMAGMSEAIMKGVPMIAVPDVARALDWYRSIGFTEISRYDDDGLVNFGMVSFGNADLMLSLHGKQGPHDVSLWFYTDRIDVLYQLMKSRQVAAAQAALAGEPGDQDGIQFTQDISDMFYGARQFCVRDLNGYELYFIQAVRPGSR
jgi:catechol 2,3-dioxygenase-like lactoylglutathione lyase family enzyme